MTINTLVERLQELQERGYGDVEAVMLDPLRSYDYFSGRIKDYPLTTVEELRVRGFLGDSVAIEIMR